MSGEGKPPDAAVPGKGHAGPLLGPHWRGLRLPGAPGLGGAGGCPRSPGCPERGRPSWWTGGAPGSEKPRLGPDTHLAHPRRLRLPGSCPPRAVCGFARSAGARLTGCGRRGGRGFRTGQPGRGDPRLLGPRRLLRRPPLGRRASWKFPSRAGWPGTVPPPGSRAARGQGHRRGAPAGRREAGFAVVGEPAGPSGSSPGAREPRLAVWVPAVPRARRRLLCSGVPSVQPAAQLSCTPAPRSLRWPLSRGWVAVPLQVPFGRCPSPALGSRST